MKYTSLQVEAASRQLEAISSAKQLLVVGGVATSHAMALDYARAECEVASQQGINANLEPEAMTLPYALENPGELLGKSETYIKALSAGTMAVCEALRNGSDCEQPAAITGQGAPSGDKSFEDLLLASVQGMREVPLKYRIRSLKVAQHLPLYWKVGKEAAKFSALDHAMDARANGKQYDLVDFDRDRFFGHTEDQHALAASNGVNIYRLQGVHNEHFRNGSEVARNYLIHAVWRAHHQDTEEELASV